MVDPDEFKKKVEIEEDSGVIRLGGGESWGVIVVRNNHGLKTLSIDGGGNISAGGNGQDGDLAILGKDGRLMIHLDGDTGDIKLEGADCAENFEISEANGVEPGSVMVIDQDGKLQQCKQAYDNKVAGVISGAGDCKPGIILNKGASEGNSLPLALHGKVFCKVDAQYAPIEIGSLLTTSDTPGYARKADDPVAAFGSVIGKALKPLTEGKGLIPILIALQ